jgi:hypothetical protein
VTIPFDPSLDDMAGREPFRNKQGEIKVENAWHSIVSQVSQFVVMCEGFATMVIAERRYSGRTGISSPLSSYME